MSNLIRDFWSYTTVLIENEWGGKGTGFLLGDEKKEKIFVITNKHVLNSDVSKRQNFTRIKFVFNIENESNKISRHEVEATVKYEGSDKNGIIREHPDNNTDVMAFNITDLLNKVPPLSIKGIPYEYLASPRIIEEMNIKIADEIMVLGYPFLNKLRHQVSNFPLVRQGIIASQINENLEDFGFGDDEKDKRILRGFLIDGAIIPGSSGSPVILKPTMGRYLKDSYLVDKFQPVLLGIVFETRYGIIRGERDEVTDHKSYINLGLAHNAETINETINLFK